MMKLKLFSEKSLRFLAKLPQDAANITILSGAVRSGKTVNLIPKFFQYADYMKEGTILFTGVSKDTVYNNYLRFLLEGYKEKYDYTYNRSTGDLYFLGRHIKVIGAKDKGSEKFIRGGTFSGAFCDELSLMPKEFLIMLLSRLSVKGSKLYGTTNPEHPYHYLYTDYITNKELIASGMCETLKFTLDDNPNLDDDYRRFLYSAYTGVYYKRYIEGKWVAAGGLVYDNITDENKYDDEPLLASPYRRYIAIDYGTINPCIFLEILVIGNNIYVNDEYYWDSRVQQRQKTDPEYADDLKAFLGKKKYSRIIVDPSAASFKLELQRRGYLVKDANNSVAEGITLTASLLALKALKIRRKCKNTCKEMENYKWNEDKLRLGVEEPVKENDHTCDAIRYLCKTVIRTLRRIA